MRIRTIGVLIPAIVLICAECFAMDPFPKGGVPKQDWLMSQLMSKRMWKGFE